MVADTLGVLHVNGGVGALATRTGSARKHSNHEQSNHASLLLKKHKSPETFIRLMQYKADLGDTLGGIPYA